MNDSIHGHEVLALLEDDNTAYTRDSFLAAIITHFGAEARFHTCSAQDMAPHQLLDFLEARNKFHESKGQLLRTPNSACHD